MKHKTIGLFFLCLLAGSAFIWSCRSKQIKTIVAEPDEQTAFYTLTLLKDTIKHQTLAEIKNVNVVNTKIRYMPDGARAKEPNFLRIEVIYRNGKSVQAVTEHPLYKRVELYSESGQIEAKLISLQQGEVTFRIPYFADYKKISIQETVNFKALPTIILKNEK